MKTTSKLLLWWIPPAFAITLVMGLIYTTGQQILRQSANDPQIQIAEDMGGLLSGGISPQALISNGVPVEISKGLSAYAAIFDDSGKLILSTGVLHGKPIELPTGALDAAKKNGENIITWQPEKGVRSAVVIVHYTGSQSGYVVVGRSLREIEKRETRIGLPVLLVWIVILIILFITIFIIHRREIKAVESL